MSMYEIQWLEDSDIVVIPKGLKTMFLKCCDCGLCHRIEFNHRSSGDLHLQFIRLDEEPKMVETPTTLEIISEE